MNDAFAALQRLRAAKIAAVAGVLPASARAPQPEVRTPVPVPNPSVVIPMPAPASTPVVANAVTALRKRAESSKGYVTESRRIAALPTWDYASMLARCQPGGDLDYTPRFRVPGGTMHLKPIQNLALYWIEQRRGLVGSLAVGSGKTLLSLLASQVLKAQRPILFIPPTMQIPLRREMEKLAKHFVMPKNLYIIPYSQLSVAKSSDLLEQIKPDLIICDEAHNARNPDAARTKRILRYANQFPSTRFVMLSGTLTSRSLKDYGHLCELALREGSPIPTEAADLLAWANCLDSGSVPQQKDWSIFAAFHDVRHINDEEKRKEAARDAFRERLNATPGVVATREASVACSLNLYERALSVPPSVQEALRELHATWTRPDGEEMPSALDLWRLGMQISQGFYMKWAWPNGVVDWEWMNARSEWHRQVRRLLQDNVTGMDSPLLVWNAVSRGVVTDPIVVRAFQAWEAVKHRPPPPVETVWVDDFLVRDALAWLKEHPKGIVWHNDRATEIALREAGVPTYGAGEVPPLDGSKGGLALSIRVHGTGLNLQHAHSENLFMSFPSSGKTMEQLIGRTHRQGQEADEVGCWYYAHTTDTSMAVMRAREDARYIETTQGSPMKLNLCTWA